MNYHTIHTMRVDDCQEMIMTGDYMKICRLKTINPIVKRKARKKHYEFIEQLQELFSGEDIGKMVEVHALVQGMELKRKNLIMLHDGLKLCYDLKDIPDKIKTLNSLKEHYRNIFFDYPKTVDVDAEPEEQKKQVEAVLNPIRSEITRLEYKIKQNSPKPKENREPEEQKQMGLTLHIAFIEAMDNRNIDRRISVWELKVKYDQAVEKNNKLKAQDNG